MLLLLHLHYLSAFNIIYCVCSIAAVCILEVLRQSIHQISHMAATASTGVLLSVAIVESIVGCSSLGYLLLFWLFLLLIVDCCWCTNCCCCCYCSCSCCCCCCYYYYCCWCVCSCCIVVSAHFHAFPWWSNWWDLLCCERTKCLRYQM